MSTKSTSTCINHPDRPAIGYCQQCHKPLCSACRDDSIPDGIFCGQDCYDRHLAYRSRQQPVIRSSRLKSMVIGLVILAALAAGALYVGGKVLGIAALEPLAQSIFG